MLQLACLWLALNDGNGNMIQWKFCCLQSSFKPLPFGRELFFVVKGLVVLVLYIGKLPILCSEKLKEH